MKVDNNETRKKFKQLLACSGVTLTDLVKEYNQLHPDEATTTQNLNNKLARETIKLKEVSDLADILGYEVAFIKK